ncbi:MAG: GHKL domain-containing protein [Bdellovibrionales bacterium]|jgi:signal transduction histidine kinase|nr:GHKL domain-containing protein [Bdellovibrionales bacterium]MBT3524734.1 GHKL domain-containing protein [Bdellovibrionales bacterium]MBT7767131.1 GHKL domain-containing protein [Bdellovibrionales bacterium]
MQNQETKIQTDLLENGRIDLLFNRKISLIISAGLMTLAFFWYLLQQNVNNLNYWLIYSIFWLLCLGITTTYYNRNRTMSLAKKYQMEIAYLLLLFLFGLSWGATSFLFIPKVTVMGGGLIVVMAGGILFGGLQGAVASTKGAAIFTLSVIGPYLIYGISRGTTEGTLIAAATILLFIILLKSAKENFEYLLAGQLTRQAQQVIIDKLSEKVESENESLQHCINNFHNDKLIFVEEMSVGLAHQINNPLSILSAHLGRIKKTLQAHDDAVDERAIEESDAHEKLSKSLEQLEQMVARISGIVKNLQGLSRSSDDDPMERVTLKKLIDISMLVIKGKIDSSQSELQIELQEASEWEIDCHSNEISQVLAHIIGNACDAVKQLDQRWIKIAASREGEQIILSIIDSGFPPSLEVTKRIFEPFYTTKGQGKGTGLGLAHSSQIMERHSGKLQLDHSSSNTKFDMIFVAIQE